MGRKPAYLPLFVRDFISDQLVLRLTWVEQGVHLRMLMASWECGPLPDDPYLVARQIGWDGGLGLADDGPLTIEPAIRKVWGLCWVRTERGWESRRLEAERQHTADVLEQQRARAAHARAVSAARSNVSPNVRADASQQSQAQAQAQEKKREEPPSIPPVGGRPPRKRVTLWEGEIPIPLSSPRFRDLWHTWLVFRRDEKRKPVTQLSGEQALLQLVEMGLERACKAIEYTIAMGWQGLREPEPARNGNGNHADHSDDRKRTLRAMGMI